MNPRPDRRRSRSQAGETCHSWLRRRRRLPHRPGLEALEPRVVLSPTIYSVDSTGNGTGGSGTSGTLPYVISQANVDPNPDGSEIEFDSTVFSSPRTITLGESLSLAETSGPEVIGGPGAALLSISGGGAVTVLDVDSDVTATLSRLTITGGGGAPSSGSGLVNSGTATIDDCTISGNSAFQGGGVYNNGTAVFSGCTISGNSAGAGGGGGLLNTGTATLEDCTIANNDASSGSALYDKGSLSVTACTISGNTTPPPISYPRTHPPPAGTALQIAFFVRTVTLTNTIVAGNSDGLDLSYGDATVTGTNNLEGGDPMLAPLGDYGGPTETMAVLPGSPAIGAGTAVSGITTDQRGVALPQAGIDIGAFQGQGFTLTPVADSTPQQATDGIAFPNPLAFTVTANDPMEPVAGGVLTFSAPASGASAALSAGTVTIGTDGSASVIAADNSIAGSYDVTVSASGVGSDSFNLTNQVSSPVATYTVNSTGGGFSGSGTSGTLAYVLFLAGADASPQNIGNTIDFDPSIFSTAQTINPGSTLSLSETSGPEEIDGPGAGLLSINGGGAFTVFQVNSGVTATLTGLTITGGGASSSPYVSAGGLSNDGTVSLSGCTISGNSAGVTDRYSALKTTLTDCTISGNSGFGGLGLFGTSSLTGCTISGNYSGGGPGGLALNGTSTVTNCTISGNSSGRGVGGLDLGGTSTLTDCTITDNGGDKGGGLWCGAGTSTLTDCTISGNSANQVGGILIYHGATAVLTDDIVAGNTYSDPSLMGVATDISSVEPSAVVTGTYNLIGPGSGGIVGGVDGNIVLTSLDGLDLGPLANNGGPTLTMALLPGSPAVGAGTASIGVTTDQRGLPLDAPPDIGAYQVQASTLAVDSIGPVAPSPRNAPVESVLVTLNKRAGSAGIGAGALTLTDDGGPNLIDGAVTVTLVSGANYRISGLSGLTVAEGSYTLAVAAADIMDANGNAGAGTQSTSWLMDATPPTSTVDALPSQTTSTSFTVSVTASDPPGADGGAPSGVASITIYESANGEPFVRFATVSPSDPSATFTGQEGATYAFYSVATDEAGNIQPTAAVPQATITLGNEPAVVVGQQPDFRQKLNKKGKPVGKAMLTGFTLDFGTPLDATAADDPAHFGVETLSTRKVKKKLEHILHPISGFKVSYDAVGDSVTITLGRPEKFLTGGQVTVLGGVMSASGGPLSGPTIFAISKGGKSIVPG
jgi:Right handed beta helix region